MSNYQLAIEIIKLSISFLTPLLVVIVGLLISKKIEKNKFSVLKEKEWQVKWAELFLKDAIEFNSNVTNAICLLFHIQTESDNDKINEMINTVKECFNRISEIDWNIRNYTQFAKINGEEILRMQSILMSSIGKMVNEKKGNLEEIRKQQFNYYNAVRKAHSEILNSTIMV